MPAWDMGVRSGTRADSDALSLTSDHKGVLFTVTDEDGILERWDGSAWQGVGGGATRLDKLDATVDPDANDDSGDGYSVGSLWINVTDDTVWRCADSTSTAAVWLHLTTNTRALIYDTGSISTGSTFYIPDSILGSSGSGLVSSGSNQGMAFMNWYRTGTFNQVFGTGHTTFEFRGATLSAGGGSFSWFIEDNDPAARLAVKNQVGWAMNFLIWSFTDADNLA